MDTPLSVLLKDKGYTIQTVVPRMSVYDCALKLVEFNIGALLVLDNDILLGVVSERDILLKIVAVGADPKNTTVEAIMTKEIFTVLPSTTVGEAMRIVTDNRVRHLPVLNKGKLIGVISIGDLTRWAMLLQEKQISSLTDYIQGGQSL